MPKLIPMGRMEKPTLENGRTNTLTVTCQDSNVLGTSMFLICCLEFGTLSGCLKSIQSCIFRSLSPIECQLGVKTPQLVLHTSKISTSVIQLQEKFVELAPDEIRKDNETNFPGNRDLKCQTKPNKLSLFNISRRQRWRWRPKQTFFGKVQKTN